MRAGSRNWQIYLKWPILVLTRLLYAKSLYTYNGVKIILENGFLEETASPITIVHDLFVLCAFHKADVVGVDLKCFVLFLHFCSAIVLTRQIKRRAVKLDLRSPHL